MNTLVLGNPGTGKTYNLIGHINNFVKNGFKGSDITVLSHTRVAAKEIANRSCINGISASTIHSFAYTLAGIIKESVITKRDIKEFSEEIGIPMKGVSGESDAYLENGDEYMQVINYARAVGQPYLWAYQYKGRPGIPDEFEFFCENYDVWKKSYGYVDFNDMIDMAIKSPNVIDVPVLLIDEAQDLSPQQWKLINKISKNTRHMVVTGDPDQCIFSWGGASPESMIKWMKATGAKIEHLSQSYRVPREAYALSKRILMNIRDRYEKDYKPTDRVGSVNRFLTTSNYKFKRGNTLILYRNHSLRESIEREMIHNYVPYTVLNGPAGACHNKYGRGVKAWLRIKNSEFPDSKDISNLRMIATPAMVTAIKNNDIDAIVNMPGKVALDIPSHLFNYYKYVDFKNEGNIKLSTIHGAKGMEADRVILINGMTQRVYDESILHRDNELLVWYVAITRTKNILDIIDGEGVCGVI